jgi:hypothetical protein
MVHRLRVLLLPLLFTAPLLAQHYQGRDHMIFHRPPPQAKHSLAITPGGGSVEHPSETSRHHELAVASRADKPVRNSAQSSAKTK